MKNWSILTNSYYKTAHYMVTKGPWWVYLLEWLVEYIDHILHHIPLLNSLPRDYPLSYRFCMSVYGKVLEWRDNKLWSKWVDTDYEQLKKDHPDLGMILTKQEKELGQDIREKNEM